MEARIAIEPSGTNKAFQGVEEPARQPREVMAEAIENAGGKVVSIEDANCRGQASRVLSTPESSHDR